MTDSVTVLNRRRGSIKRQITKLSKAVDEDPDNFVNLSAQQELVNKLSKKFEDLKTDYYEAIVEEEFDSIEATLSNMDDELISLEDKDHLTNTVVIQYHPLIQQKGDRIIKLYCSLFEDTNRTLSKTFRVDQGLEPPVTAVVNATAPTPNIRLRITDANGTDIGGTRIGEHLYFRIEIDEDSVFGIFARNMTARSGRGDVQISLIDENGCAIDSRIFPNFDKIPGSKSLQSRFQAFKFSEDPVVRFQVNVHFCLEECNSVVCSGGLPSYGRRRRRGVEDNDEEENIVPDYPLVTAIVVEGSQSFANSTWPQDSHYIDERERDLSDELVCTTKTVVVVCSLGALFLQIGLLAACGTCLLLTRNTKQRPRYSEDAASTVTETLPPFGSDMHHSRMR